MLSTSTKMHEHKGNKGIGHTAGGVTSWHRGMVRPMLLTIALLAAAPSFAQTMQDPPRQYSREAMEQALQTREQYDVHGLRFAISNATLRPGAEGLLDDIATALKNFPEWGLRIVGHTDSSGNEETNLRLSTERAEVIKAALVERGIDAARLTAGGVGQARPIASNETANGRALNRRVELVRITDSAEAKKLLKAMTDYLASQNALSFAYDSNFQVVTNSDQKLGLASSGTVTLSRPDKVHTTRSGGFVDSEALFDGKTLTLLGKNLNKYTQVEIPGTVDHLIDELKDKYDLPLPAADLLLTGAYDALMEGVYDSKDLGSGVINGTECDSLAFRKDDVDFQIWIAHGAQPYPCRLVITSGQVKGGPEYSVQIRDWKSGDAVAPGDFGFKNATNAEKIDVNDLKHSLGELPENFMVGDKK
ncbi:DUF2092 domain-containing protein (plasmid) [Ensifer adhaerens]|nr:DUF2092 domain-containing protein [Ensifer adhaerens]MBD9520584.1 DUF2092 domain-containing protein [Ensifer sp. ENS02]MBD9541725.1 DUF2092 domain-containing protein [Ensifer sp. ENS04]SFH01950.1 hypothetical protein SAMN05216459_1147 [Ensifer sp. OV372]QHG72949.1 DUF2092 domain-containing protein [Ensifer adhaerens]RAS04079.1 hypothetical protein DEU52_12751 [Ensifer adhaerens]